MLKRRHTLSTALSSGVVQKASLEHIVKIQCRTSVSAEKFKLSARHEGGDTTMWAKLSELGTKYKTAVNLGLGMPDFSPPERFLKALCKVSISENPLVHQYTRGFGLPRLVQNLAKLYSPLISRNIDPLNEIVVTCGATEALYATMMGHLDEGDEVIVIEPFIDCYYPMFKCAGGFPKYIALTPRNSSGNITASDWVLDEKELTNLFNERTKMFILNNPHNPTGKVFTKDELGLIASLCKKHNVLCVSDEVYEWMVYEPKSHIRIGSLPGMWERTITIGSGGKTFLLTGWRSGWAYGPASLMRNVQIAHHTCVYVCPTPIQEAVASMFEFELTRRDAPDSYLKSLAREALCKRDIIVRALQENGFILTIPEAGFFILADWTQLVKKVDLLSTEKGENKDFLFTKRLTKEAGILTVPLSIFYSDEHKHLAQKYIRFCYIKKDENLQLAANLLKKWHSDQLTAH